MTQLAQEFGFGLRYHLHAGFGRTWQTDPTLAHHSVSHGDDLKDLRAQAFKLQVEYDWWQIYDGDDGMGSVCGWSTGRTSIKLRDIDQSRSMSCP